MNISEKSHVPFLLPFYTLYNMLTIFIYLSDYILLDDFPGVKNYILVHCLLYGLLSVLSRLKYLDLSS
jgi:hypothetical protein